MRYPTRLLTDDEEILRQFRPHWRVLLPALGWAMLLAAIVGGVFAALDEPNYGWYALIAAVVLWLVIVSRRLLAWWFTNYVLTTERIIVRSGMIARTGTEIPLENINNVLFNQRVMERLLGYGDVIVESAGREGRSRLMDIPDPEAFQSQIYRARELRSLHFTGGGARPHVVQQLESLAGLRERGHLTDDEFAIHKAHLLERLRRAQDAPVDLDEEEVYTEDEGELGAPMFGGGGEEDDDGRDEGGRYGRGRYGRGRYDDGVADDGRRYGRGRYDDGVADDGRRYGRGRRGR